MPVIVGLLLLGVQNDALALGTASGTNVTSQATVDFEVDGVTMNQVSSNAASFLVDNKVDLTVTTLDAAGVQVVNGALAQVLTYSVTNDGNTVQDYSLAAQAATGNIFGITDNFDATNVQVFVDANANGTYESATDTQTYIDELVADASITVFVVADMPASQNNGDGALYDLIAQTAVGGTGSAQGADITTDDAAAADDPNTVQIVFGDDAGSADAANDGAHSSTDAYVIVTATLQATKSQMVVTDPINGGTNPKAIPEATVRYTIAVTNNGSVDAENVSIVDMIPTDTSYVAGTLTLGGSGLTDADDADEGDYNVTNAGGLTVVLASIAPAATSTITFDVTVD